MVRLAAQAAIVNRYAFRRCRKLHGSLQDRRGLLPRTARRSTEYDPIESGDVDLEDLKSRYLSHVNLDHAAAIRGILVREDKRGEWKWIWCVGLLHEEILKESSYPKLWARFRNQFPMMPRIEFESWVDVKAALSLLLQETPIKEADVINIETTYGRAMSIGDFLGNCIRSRLQNPGTRAEVAN